ncbi:MAG: hypothetical protein HGB00_07150 [Chlorobiaceae bacterium]|nr:hypothetical protein [Chlorobiaceae bacterium]
MRLLNQHIVVLTLIGMFMQINCVLAYHGLFFLNRKAIAETACEKKTEECSGHCFLQKKIDAEQDPQPSSTEKPSSSKSLDDILNMVNGLEPVNRQPHLERIAVQRFDDSSIYRLSSGSLRRIDHPPEA